MIINRERKFIFVHIPKAAGTFVSKFLLQYVEGSEKINQDGDGHYGVDKALELVPKSQRDDYFTFCSVRNPYRWYPSLYAHNRRHNAHEWRLWGGGCKGFRMWVKKMLLNQTEPGVVKRFAKDTTSTATLYREMAKSNLPMGWLSHRFIYSTCMNWRDIFEQGCVEGHEDGLRINHVVRTESIKENILDLAATMQLTTEELQGLRDMARQNVSPDLQPFEEYYSDALYCTMQERERGLLDDFDYSYPEGVK